MYKKAIYCLLAIVAWHSIARFCKAQTDGFSVAKVQSDRPYADKWRVAEPPLEEQQKIVKILSQPFHYLGGGGQCFAFASEDGQYVIKFFKHRFYKLDEILLQLPLPHHRLDQMRKKRIHRIASKIERDCSSYKLAYEEIPEETGLIYLHLHPKEGFNQSVTIVDKLGITHLLSLNSMAFILQKRAEPIDLYLKRLMEAGEAITASQAIHKVVETIAACAKKEIVDDDPAIYRNFGFIADQPMFIDVGRFQKKREIDLKKVMSRFRLFLEERHPQLVVALDEELDAI